MDPLHVQAQGPALRVQEDGGRGACGQGGLAHAFDAVNEDLQRPRGHLSGLYLVQPAHFVALLDYRCELTEDKIEWRCDKVEEKITGARTAGRSQ